MTAPERRDWEAIVVGLGAIGSAAAYWLSRRFGERVLGLEQFEFDHPNGSSADHSRIIRLSYHRPDYVRLARRAYESWAVVEAEARERIVTVTGGLDLWPADPAIPEVDYVESLAAEGVPFERLDAVEVMRRWPQWRLSPEVTGLWQRQGGLADPFKGNAAHRRLARAHGASLLDHVRVTALRDAGGGDIEVDDRRRDVPGRPPSSSPPTPGRTSCWRRSVVGCRCQVTREQVTYFACPDPAAFAPDRFPVWIWMDDPSYLRLPDVRRGRAKGGPGLRRRAGRPGSPHVRA